MNRPQQSSQFVQRSNMAHNRKHSLKIEQYLTEVEKEYGCSKSWELRERLERGETKFAEFGR